MKIKLFIMISLLFSLSSCNKWLDIELANKVDEDKLFSKPEGFQEALAGIYSQMSKQNLYGQALTMEYLDLYAQYYSHSGVSQTYLYHKDYDYQNSGVKSTHSNIWANLYSCIAAANCVLEWTEKNGSILSETERNQIRGEALALRAYLHFDLYRMFCPDVKRSPKAQGIPYNKEFGVSLPPMYPIEEFVQQVINDLKAAEEALAQDLITTVIPYTLATKNLSDKYVARMNLYAVKAMLARAYQARGDNAKAISCAKEVIECGKFRLLEFSSIDQSEQQTDVLFSDEHIFSLRNTDIKEKYSKKLHYPEVTASSTTPAPLPFNDTYAIYESNNEDARYIKWFTLGDFTKYYFENQDFFFRKMPMIKLSEMYLIMAECNFNQDKAKALEYINMLRNHRIRNNVAWSSLTKEYIMEEMRREYLGEGQMWYAYKRNNWEIAINGGIGIHEPSDALYVFPMPLTEIEDGHRDITK